MATEGLEMLLLFFFNFTRKLNLDFVNFTEFNIPSAVCLSIQHQVTHKRQRGHRCVASLLNVRNINLLHLVIK